MKANINLMYEWAMIYAIGRALIAGQAEITEATDSSGTVYRYTQERHPGLIKKHAENICDRFARKDD